MSQRADDLSSVIDSEELGVIDEEMLVSLVIDQGPKKESGRLYVKDGIKLEEVTEIRIEFRNILNIDHLWVMRSLVKLKLSNNKIERIVNLDVLIHLQELDLSFNHIKRMENLNHLTRLEILLLFENHICYVEGVDNLIELTIFNIGNNNIVDWNHVIYLRNMNKLRSLNTTGNPCSAQEGYLDYVYAFIPQLVYFQYKMITDKERETAMEKQSRGLSKLIENQTKKEKQTTQQENSSKNSTSTSSSYMDQLYGDYLFERIFEKDKEGRDFMTLSHETQETYLEFRTSMVQHCKELYELGLAAEMQRAQEIKMFKDVVTQGHNAMHEDAQMMMDDIMEKKASIFIDVKELVESMREELDTETLNTKLEKAQRLSDEFSELVAKTWTQLMHKEVILHEQIEDMNGTFKLNMTDMVTTFIQKAQGFFTLMRNAEISYNHGITMVANNVMNNYLLNEDTGTPPHLIEICGNTDTLTNNLLASHDIHLRIIDECEDLLMNTMKSWLGDKIESLFREECNRNRQKIMEISHFLECQFEEFNAMQIRYSTHIVESKPVTIGLEP